jgi:hypothetical protein
MCWLENNKSKLAGFGIKKKEDNSSSYFLSLAKGPTHTHTQIYIQFLEFRQPSYSFFSKGKIYTFLYQKPQPIIGWV